MGSNVADAPARASAYLTFEIERGTGETLETIGPLFLLRAPYDDERSRKLTRFAMLVLEKLGHSDGRLLDELRALGP